MTCRVRIQFDPDHPTCRSCQRQGIPCSQKKRKKARQAVSGGPFVRGSRRGWVSTYDLQSCNKHVNHPSGDKVYRGIKRQWGKVLANAAYHFGLADGKKRRMEVVRFVASRRQIMDEDNLWASLKPMVDCLVAQGVLVDDSREWVEHVAPREVVDRIPRVEIFIDDI